MKCAACGYEYEVDYTNPNNNKGDEEFRLIKGTFMIKSGDWGEQWKDVALFACPKCNTVIMNEWA